MKINSDSQTNILPLWRSMLFVPAHLDRFIDRAHTRGADALILDLEDSVPLAEKAPARARVVSTAARVSRNGADVLVRVNANWRLAIRDLEAVVNPAIAAIVVPKVSSAEQLQSIDEVITELEIESGMQAGFTRMVAQIESPVALARLEAIANAGKRLVGMSLGSEDFSAAAGMQPNPDGLLFPSQQIVFAARAAGLLPLGFVDSITNFSDLQAFRKTILRARNLGFIGGFCIHPNQVKVMNDGFTPSEEEIIEARKLMQVYLLALKRGEGAAEFKGKMIDAPVVSRAEALVRMAEKIALREAPRD
jgi:citrate lyase subunit beta/citryl-CoA lyase